MLVNFFTVDVAATANNFSDFANNFVPNYTCLYFSTDLSRYVFCLDASIDAAAICLLYNFTYNFVHEMEVEDNLYCRDAYIAINGFNKYKLMLTP